jgi:hypothetical protein
MPQSRPKKGLTFNGSSVAFSMKKRGLRIYQVENPD